MEIYKQLASFQQECPIIHKGTSGYGYSYADLPTIFGVINPLLKKHNLGFSQLVNTDGVKTIVFTINTDEPQQIESTTPIPQDVQLKGMNDFQVLGSAITYIRRYALSSILGIVTDKATDAGGEHTKKAAPKQQEADKPWLNEGSEEFNKAKDYITKGGSITEIRKKYAISKKVAELLTK